MVNMNIKNQNHTYLPTSFTLAGRRWPTSPPKKFWKTGILPGHCLLSKHFRNHCLVNKGSCECFEIKEETPLHFAVIRTWILGQHQLRKGEIPNLEITQILNFSLDLGTWIWMICNQKLSEKDCWLRRSGRGFEIDLHRYSCECNTCIVHRTT